MPTTRRTRARPRPPTRLVHPAPTPIERLVALPGQISDGIRLYRRTPARLRRPEPAARAAVTAGAAWAVALFGALGILVSRSAPPPTLPAGVPVTLAFFAVAVLAGSAGAVYWTRRTRLGLQLLAAAAILGPAVAVAAALASR